MNSMKALARNLTIRYALVQGFFWISFSAILGFSVIFLKWKQFNTAQIGIILALGAVCSVIMQPVVAAFADKTTKISVKNITVIILLFNLLFTILMLVLPYSFILTACLFIFINAIVYSLPPLLNAMALEYMNDGILINYGLARGLGSVSFAIMSYFLGFMIADQGAFVLLPIFLISSVLLTIVTFTFRVSKSQKEAFSKQNPIKISHIERTQTQRSFISFFLHYKKFSIQIIGIILLFTFHNMANTYLIQILEEVGGNSSHQGISLAIAAALELPTMAIFVYLLRKIKCGILLKASAFFFVVKAFILVMATNVAMVYLSQAFQMVSYALFTPAAVDYVNKIMEDQDKVKGQAYVGVATMGVSGILGNVLAGQIIESAGVPYMVIASAIISAAGFIILFFSTDNIA